MQLATSTGAGYSYILDKVLVGQRNLNVRCHRLIRTLLLQVMGGQNLIISWHSGGQEAISYVVLPTCIDVPICINNQTNDESFNLWDTLTTFFYMNFQWLKYIGSVIGYRKFTTF